MKRFGAAALGLFWVVSTLLITSVWALEVTVGGEFRFRARQRTDFDLQSFNLNGGIRSFSVPDIETIDAPVGATTYGGSELLGVAVKPGNVLQIVQDDPTVAGPTRFLNVTTGQFEPGGAAFPAGGNFFFDGTAAEEHFGYSASFSAGTLTPVARLGSLRPGSYPFSGALAVRAQNVRELARPHADVGNNDRDYIYDRIRVSVDAKIIEGLRAYAMFENYSDWGLSRGGLPTLSVPQFGGGEGGSGTYGDRAGVNIRYAWVDFVVPKTPVHVKIGRQPFSLGHGILFNSYNWGSDMAYVYAPIGPVTVGAFYGKFLEVDRANADDASYWGLHADFAINPANKISTFYRYAWQKTTRYIALGSTSTGAFGGPLVFGGPLNSNHKYEANQHGWGITADGKINVGKANIFYAFEADILWGQYTDWKEPRNMKPWGYWDIINARTPLQMQEDLYQVAWGYGVQVGVDFKWIKFDLAHSWGSGDKTRASNEVFIPFDGGGSPVHHQWTTGRRVEAFDAWGSDNMYSPWYTDIFMGSAKSASFGGSGLGTLGFTRRWGYTGDFGDLIMLKPTLAVKSLDNLTLDISYAAFWKSSSTNTNGAGVGSTIDGENGTIILWKSNANNREQPNKQKINPFLGQELNTHLTYYPYKNLLIKGWAGVFFPGDWFKVQQRSHNADVPSKGHDTVGLKPAWALQLDVIVAF